MLIQDSSRLQQSVTATHPWLLLRCTALKSRDVTPTMTSRVCQLGADAFFTDISRRRRANRVLSLVPVRLFFTIQPITEGPTETGVHVFGRNRNENETCQQFLAENESENESHYFH